MGDWRFIGKRMGCFNQLRACIFPKLNGKSPKDWVLGDATGPYVCPRHPTSHQFCTPLKWDPSPVRSTSGTNQFSTNANPEVKIHRSQLEMGIA